MSLQPKDRALDVCPFCGLHTASLSQHEYRGVYFVVCGNCDAQGPAHLPQRKKPVITITEAKRAAINGWNRRGWMAQ